MAKITKTSKNSQTAKGIITPVDNVNSNIEESSRLVISSDVKGCQNVVGYVQTSDGSNSRLNILEKEVNLLKEENVIMRLDISQLSDDVARLDGDMLIIRNDVNDLSNKTDRLDTRITIVENQLEDFVPKRLEILPSTSTMRDRSKMKIYVNDDGVPSYANLKETLGTILRLDDKIPEDMQSGEFIFLEQNLRGINNN